MSERFDRDDWDAKWSAALAAAEHDIDKRPPNAHLVAAAADLKSGIALDAGSGHGAETLWLAERGWNVTAVDFSATALEHARGAAERHGAEVASRIEWVEADLGEWTPRPAHFDLVACIHVHIAGAVDEFVRRMGSAVVPGGHLLLVGHRPIDPATGLPTPATDQNQVSVEEVVDALGLERWEFLVAQDHPRQLAGSGVDAVVLARSRPAPQ